MPDGGGSECKRIVAENVEKRRSMKLTKAAVRIRSRSNNKWRNYFVRGPYSASFDAWENVALVVLSRVKALQELIACSWSGRCIKPHGFQEYVIYFKGADFSDLLQIFKGLDSRNWNLVDNW